MAIEKVKAYFRKYGMEERVQEFDSSSATVELAAAMVHCHMRRSVISIGRPDNLMTEITWKTICFFWSFYAFYSRKIVISCNPIKYGKFL